MNKQGDGTDPVSIADYEECDDGSRGYCLCSGFSISCDQRCDGKCDCPFCTDETNRACSYGENL